MELQPKQAKLELKEQNSNPRKMEQIQKLNSLKPASTPN